MAPFTESVVEEAAYAWLEAFDYKGYSMTQSLSKVKPELSAATPNYRGVVMEGRFDQPQETTSENNTL